MTTPSAVAANAAGGARRARHSTTVHTLARWGLGSRALVYLVMAWLTVQIAVGNRSHQANQRGAIAEIAQQPLGLVLLVVLAVGLVGYAVWRFLEAAWGTAADGDDTGARLKSLVRGIIYTAFAVTTVAFLLGDAGGSQGRQQRTTTARLMQHGWGVWLVGIAGAVVVVVGITMIVEGVRTTFTKELQMDRLQGRTRTVVVRLGAVGTVARGVVVGVAGALAVDAAATYAPAKSTGLDGALHTLAGEPFGPWLLGIIAAGLAAFALYGFACVKWAKV